MTRHGGMTTADLRRVAVVLLICLWWPSGAALTHERPGPTRGEDAKHDEIDSEHIFGITEGSDVGDAGETEAEVEPFGRFGKRGGSYAATSTLLTYKYTPIENFRIAPLLTFASHNISNVPGLDNIDRFTFEGAGAELRWRL